MIFFVRSVAVFWLNKEVGGDGVSLSHPPLQLLVVMSWARGEAEKGLWWRCFAKSMRRRLSGFEARFELPTPWCDVRYGLLFWWWSNCEKLIFNLIVALQSRTSAFWRVAILVWPGDDGFRLECLRGCQPSLSWGPRCLPWMRLRGAYDNLLDDYRHG